MPNPVVFLNDNMCFWKMLIHLYLGLLYQQHRWFTLRHSRRAYVWRGLIYGETNHQGEVRCRGGMGDRAELSAIRNKTVTNYENMKAGRSYWNSRGSEGTQHKPTLAEQCLFVRGISRLKQSHMEEIISNLWAFSVHFADQQHQYHLTTEANWSLTQELNRGRTLWGGTSALFSSTRRWVWSFLSVNGSGLMTFSSYPVGPFSHEANRPKMERTEASFIVLSWQPGGGWWRTQVKMLGMALPETAFFAFFLLKREN